jgi:hypothetical protein
VPESIPESEPRISAQDLADILQQVGRWDEAVRSGELPDRTKAFLVHQLDLIRRAVRDYAISGAAAFREAAQDAAMAWANEGEVVEPYAEAEEVKAVRGLWSEIQRRAEPVVILWALTRFILLDAPAALERMREWHILPPAPTQTSPRLPSPHELLRPNDPDFEIVGEHEPRPGGRSW